ncbi:hypothetical protein GGR50DRAFT_662629 [Xylaria sp. CBS 124048]|nr:hypothetical protein GGR50DRAFT_662629 [Xylaria sp. CBS 124048]
MESDETPEHYYTYDGRLESFQPPQTGGRRGSTAKGKAPKALTWPHKQLDPDVFARAGFYFQPSPDAPDNTVCFLCQKNMKGWERDDDPFEEHLRLSPHCGWAIVAGIEVGLGDYNADDPTSAAMIAARKATFADRWPHDGKRGWKCKTKQLVDAGWKYTPTSESDDMATCTYCHLALDGWEPKDNPMDEHYRRSPDCPFFVLMNQYKSAAPAKKKGRGKGARTSKASRLSTQSVATAASDMTSLLDNNLPDNDDSIMTTTSVMTQGGAKRTRAKKGTAKGKKSRAKKDEVVEVLEDPPEPALSENQSLLPLDESIQAGTPPAHPKPRGRKRVSAAMEDSVLTTNDAPAPKKRATRNRVTSAKTAPPDIEYSLADPMPSVVDENAVDAELKASEVEMEYEPEQTLHVPKKGRQAGTRKASKQTTKKAKAKAPVEPTPEPQPPADPGVDELAEGHESIISNGTVIRTSLASTSGSKKRGRLSKKSASSLLELQSKSTASPSLEPEAGVERLDFAEAEPEPTVIHERATTPVTKESPLPREEESPPPPVSDQENIEPPRTPRANTPSATTARQAAVSPSQSPQASDAENQPPSSKPSDTARSSRVALEPTTPVQSSPSKRNFIAGLQSTCKWTAVDIEMILDEIDKENAQSTGHFLRTGIDLTSPEKQMTVEEWIYHNAEQAEKKLKIECETIVTAFEREGTRAMQALEGLIVE